MQNLQFAVVESSKAMSNIQFHFIYPVAFFKYCLDSLSYPRLQSHLQSVWRGICQEPEIAPLKINTLVDSDRQPIYSINEYYSYLVPNNLIVHNT